jgi:ABC-type transport system involved in multi-copper enzyme maturation permease subunit
MTASTITGAVGAPASTPFGRFAGLRSLFRKDVTEWVRGKRAWVILAVTTAFMILTAANSWFVHQIAAGLPAGEVPQEQLGSLVPADNLIAAIASQMFVVAAIFVAGSLLARERESGTLAWVASKPVTRASIWASKWVSSTVMLAVVAGIVPLGISVAVVTLLYGVPPIGLIVGIVAGVVATIAFFTAVGFALGTVIPGQAATIAAGFTVWALLPMIGGILPIEAYLPTSILSWPAAALTGQAAPIATPIAWFVVTAGLAGLAIRRMGRIEL